MIGGALVGDRELVQRFKRLAPALKTEVDRETDRLGFELQGLVQRDYLTGQVLHVQSGRLRASINRGNADTRSHFESTPVSAFAFVGTNVSYGRIWELDGIAAHDIVPIKAKALRFTVGGQVLFRKRVHIPAQGPRPYLSPALQQMRPQIIVAYQHLLTRVSTQVLKG